MTTLIQVMALLAAIFGLMAHNVGIVVFFMGILVVTAIDGIDRA